MFCPKCGNQLPDNAHFCGKCGSPVSENIPQQVPVQQATPADAQKAQATAQYFAGASAAPQQPIQQQSGQQQVPASNSSFQGGSVLPEFDNTVKEYTLQTGLLPWFKEKISVSPTMVKGSYPSSILSVIPFGINEISVPIDHISNIGMHTKLQVGKLVAGIIASLIGIGFIMSGDLFIFFGVLVLLWGIYSCANAYLCAIRYEKSGKEEYIFAIFFEKNKLQEIAGVMSDQVEKASHKVLTYQQMATTVGAQQASTAAIVDALNSRS